MPSTNNVTRPARTPAVYTVAEVCHLLNLSRGMTYAMVRSGQIPAKKLGDRWIVPKARFHEWLDECTAPTDPHTTPTMTPTTTRRNT